MAEDLTPWNRTYRCDRVRDMGYPAVVTAIHGDGAPYRIVSELQLRVHAGSVSAQVEQEMTPAELRTLAALLIAAADRVETELNLILDALNSEVAE